MPVNRKAGELGPFDPDEVAMFWRVFNVTKPRGEIDSAAAFVNLLEEIEIVRRQHMFLRARSADPGRTAVELYALWWGHA